MRSRRGGSQLLPTPQTSTTSKKTEEEEDNILLSSEIDDSSASYYFSVVTTRNLRSRTYSTSNSSNTCSTSSTSNTCNTLRCSWPFRSNSGDSYEIIKNFDFDFDLDVDVDKDFIKLKRLLKRDFPFERVIEGLSEKSLKLLFDKDLWTFLLKISTIYTGNNVRGDRQKRNEVAFAAWTTLLRFYGGRVRVRGGEEQMKRLAVASVVLQSKLLEESDVDLINLEKKMKKLTKISCEKEKIEICERKISSRLQWKLLVPSPQVILFTSLDALNLPTNLKIFVSKVLDQLMEEFFIQEYIKYYRRGISSLIVSVIEIVLCDFFSVFHRQRQRSDQNIKKLLKKNLPIEGAALTLKEREKIENAIETVMSET